MKQTLFRAIVIGVFLIHALWPSVTHAQTNTLKVLTFNTWLLDIPIYPFGLRHDISQDMNERLKKMPDVLAETNADVLVLQEVWSPSSKNTLIEKMRERGYPYAAYTTASRWLFMFQTAMGDGLLVLSKFPISKHALHHDFTQATQSVESFTNKGVMKIEIEHPTQGLIDVYASHLGAIQFENGDYIAEQLAGHQKQLSELAEFMRTTRKNPIAILAADLNMHYKKWDKASDPYHFVDDFSDAYLKLKKSACGFGQDLNDTYLTSHSRTAQEEPDYTFDHENPYVGEGYYGSLPSEVEDYIFICENAEVKTTDSKVVFKKNPISDHYGVLTTLETISHQYKTQPLAQTDDPTENP